MPTPTITAFATSPDRGQGLARDMPVRWAFEEVGQPYDVRLVSFGEMKEPPHRARQPFGQIPSYEEGGVSLFESGAIVLHIAQAHAGLLPADPAARARAISWMFAAVSSVEPVVVQREAAIFTERDKPWHAERMAMVEERIRARLAELANALGDSDWLAGAFSGADILMVQVLRRLGSSNILGSYPNLTAYIARGQARPAYQRAFAAQLAVFEALQKKG